MNVRVTVQAQTANMLANLRRQQATIANVQNQISSGLQVSRPSDNPTAFAAISLSHSVSRRSDAYTQTLSDATAALNVSTAALQNVNDALTQAKQLASQGIDQTLDPASREALATQVDSLLSRVLTDANSTADGKYLFGGSATESPPFVVSASNSNNQPTTVTYTGAATRTTALISPNQTVDTKYVGSQVFQRTGGDVFAALVALRDTLRDTSLSDSQRSAALTQQIGVVDDARIAVSNSLGEQSASLASLDAIGGRVASLKLSADTHSSELESTDYAAAVVKLQEQDNAFKATLAISANLFQTSLIDFLK